VPLRCEAAVQVLRPRSRCEAAVEAAVKVLGPPSKSRLLSRSRLQCC
jgi:hypothetical protein